MLALTLIASQNKNMQDVILDLYGQYFHTRLVLNLKMIRK